MEDPTASSHRAVGRQLIVRADEVDQIGTAIQSPSKQLPLSALDQRDGSAPAATRTVQAKPTRPMLRRDGSAPPPPSQPPPPAPLPSQTSDIQTDTPTDSLTLPQLKQLVSQIPKVEQRAYAFQYDDAQSFAVEIEEWFQYAEQDGTMILSAKETFEQKWKSFSEAHRGALEDESSWIDVQDDVRKSILASILSSLDHSERPIRIESLEVIFYILGGAWTTTAGVEKHQSPEKQSDDEHDNGQNHSVQVEWMHKGADLLLECSGLQKLQDCMVRAFNDDENGRYLSPNLVSATELTCCSLTSPIAHQEQSTNSPRCLGDFRIREQILLLTCWYLFVESARSRANSRMGKAMRTAMR